ncbi:MAG TPA: hypothetical protein VL693_06415 [Vicinamibacterales bacterium]|jgi:hypothetical protein|nr:hypothetical protein [Vicinamibacterales bacterium]
MWRMKLLTLVLIAAALTPVAAQPQRQQPAPAAAAAADPSKKPTPKLADGHPDLNGYWAISRGPDTPVNSEFGQRNPFIKRGDWRNAKEAYADPNQPPYKPELKAKVEELARTESKTDTAFFCKPGGVPRIGPPHAILQAPGMPIVFLYQLGAGNSFRQVPTDTREHDDIALSIGNMYNGDSIGRWEGNTLVVETVGFIDETWIGIYGWFHSDKMKVVERISRVGDTLHYQATVEDPEIFTRPWTMNPWVSVKTNERIIENPPCVETDFDNLTSLDEKTKH